MPEKDLAQKRIDRWFEQYSTSLLKYILKMSNDVQQAEDLTQETFIKAYQYLVRGQDIQYPKTFLYRIVHNLTIDYLRKKRPLYMMKDWLTNKKDPDASIEDLIEFREDAKELYEALQRLKPAHRQVIILRKIEEFSIRETEEILGWSNSKVKTTLFRALRNLEKQLTVRGAANETP